MNIGKQVLMEHPPKQGLKPKVLGFSSRNRSSFNGTSTKTRIETFPYGKENHFPYGFNGTSTKTRIETFPQ